MVRSGLLAFVALAPAIAHADDEAGGDFSPVERPDDAATTTSIGGFFQPQFRLRQNSPAPNDEDGFRFARVRPQIVSATRSGNLELSAKAEMEVQPTFSLIDFYGTIGRALPDGGHVALDVGQVRTPISRQQLMGDTVLSFVDKPQFAQFVGSNSVSIVPDHDLGARLLVSPPVLGDTLRVWLGEFNGEGRNQPQNINESYLHTARVEITPLGAPTLEESAFGKPFLTIAFSGGLNQLTLSDHHDKVWYAGGDLAFQWLGISGSFEYLRAHHHQPDGDPSTKAPDYNGNGWSAQLAYLLPVKLPPYLHGRVEVAARVEEVDRNDAVPITVLGDPDQSVREYTACVSYYLRKHVLKAQLAANHFVEIEQHLAGGTSATYPNDQLVLQLTYRME